MIVNIVRTLQAELVKASSLKTPMYTAIFTPVSVIGLTWLLTVLTQRAFTTGRLEDVADLEPGSAFLVLLHYGQIGVILFGSWLVYEEQEPGSLRTSMLATPARASLFGAKAAVATLGSLLIALVTVLGAYGVRSLSVGALPLTAGGLEDARVLAGYIGYWTLLGLLAFALSATARNGLIGLGVLLSLFLAFSPYLLSLTPVARFLPDQAGAQMYQESPPASSDLGPGLGCVVLLLWVLAALISGALSFRTWAIRH